MSIGKRIVQALEQVGKTQADLARHLDTKQSTVSGWCSQGRTPAADVIPAICSFCDVSYSWLLTGDEQHTQFVKNEKENFIMESRIFNRELVTSALVFCLVPHVVPWRGQEVQNGKLVPPEQWDEHSAADWENELQIEKNIPVYANVSVVAEERIRDFVAFAKNIGELGDKTEISCPTLDELKNMQLASRQLNNAVVNECLQYFIADDDRRKNIAS